MVFVGVIEGVTVLVGVIVFVGVNEILGVIVGVTVLVGVNEILGVIVGVTVLVGVGETGIGSKARLQLTAVHSGSLQLVGTKISPVTAALRVSVALGAPMIEPL